MEIRNSTSQTSATISKTNFDSRFAHVLFLCFEDPTLTLTSKEPGSLSVGPWPAVWTLHLGWQGPSTNGTAATTPHHPPYPPPPSRAFFGWPLKLPVLLRHLGSTDRYRNTPASQSCKKLFKSMLCCSQLTTHNKTAESIIPTGSSCLAISIMHVRISGRILIDREGGSLLVNEDIIPEQGVLYG